MKSKNMIWLIFFLMSVVTCAFANESDCIGLQVRIQKNAKDWQDLEKINKNCFNLATAFYRGKGGITKTGYTLYLAGTNFRNSEFLAFSLRSDYQIAAIGQLARYGTTSYYWHPVIVAIDGNNQVDAVDYFASSSILSDYQSNAPAKLTLFPYSEDDELVLEMNPTNCNGDIEADCGEQVTYREVKQGGFIDLPNVGVFKSLEKIEMRLEAGGKINSPLWKATIKDSTGISRDYFVRQDSYRHLYVLREEKKSGYLIETSNLNSYVMVSIKMKGKHHLVLLQANEDGSLDSKPIILKKK